MYKHKDFLKYLRFLELGPRFYAFARTLLLSFQYSDSVIKYIEIGMPKVKVTINILSFCKILFQSYVHDNIKIGELDMDFQQELIFPLQILPIFDM